MLIREHSDEVASVGREGSNRIHPWARQGVAIGFPVAASCNRTWPCTSVVIIVCPSGLMSTLEISHWPRASRRPGRS
jgi:hypothetical protein